jgi:hypothetical protein
MMTNGGADTGDILNRYVNYYQNSQNLSKGNSPNPRGNIRGIGLD